MNIIDVLNDEKIEFIVLKFKYENYFYFEIVNFLIKNSFNGVVGQGSEYLYIDKKSNEYGNIDEKDIPNNLDSTFIIDDKSIIDIFILCSEKKFSLLVDESSSLIDNLDNCYFNFLNEKGNYKYVLIDFEKETVEYTDSLSYLNDAEFVKDVFEFLYVKTAWTQHEALHTTNMMSEVLYRHLVEHTYYHQQINKKFNEHIDKAIEELNNAYQVCGLGMDISLYKR